MGKNSTKLKKKNKLVAKKEAERKRALTSLVKSTLSSTHLNSSYTFCSPRLQHFSIPPNIIYYFINACASHKLFQKLQQTCKYFLSKKKVIILETTACMGISTFEYDIKGCKKLGINEKNFQYWLADSFLMIRDYSNAFKCIYRCDLRVLDICKWNLKFNEISFLLNGEKIERLVLSEGSNIRHDNENELPVTMDLVLAKCPKIKQLFYFNNLETFSSKTFEKITQLHFINKIKYLGLTLVQNEEKLNAKIFCYFLKNNVASTAAPNITLKGNISQADFDNFKLKVENILQNYFTTITFW